MAEMNIIDQLKQWGKFTEVRQVIGCGLFDCWRNGRCYRVEITDSGKTDDMFRFMVNVINPNGTQNTKARGNGDTTIDGAIQIVHWGNLEMDDNSKL